MSAEQQVASVTAVLPAYNESAVIADVVARTSLALAQFAGPGSEIVVVDDGSSDGTGDCARQAAKEVPVRVVRHERNRGYGAALRTGFESARSEAVWLMDSDGQFDPNDLRLLVDLYHSDTAVFGFRAHRSDPLIRRLNHNAFFLLVRVLFGATIRDINCAFKLFPRALGVGLHSEGAVISTELVLRAIRSGYRVVEVSVPHHPRLAGTPTGANWRVVLRAFGELAQLFRARRTLVVDGPSGGVGDRVAEAANQSRKNTGS